MREGKSKGKITISRYTSSHRDDGIIIEITDDLSRVTFVSLELSLENFARAVTGCGFVDGEMETRGLDLIGKKSEHKTIVIPCQPFGDKEKKEAAKRKMQEYEVDGWHGRERDLYNSHNHCKEGIRVSFTRYVTMAVEGKATPGAEPAK